MEPIKEESRDYGMASYAMNNPNIPEQYDTSSSNSNGGNTYRKASYSQPQSKGMHRTNSLRIALPSSPSHGGVQAPPSPLPTISSIGKLFGPGSPRDSQGNGQGNGLYSIGSQFNLFSPVGNNQNDYGAMSPATVIPITPTGFSGTPQWPTNLSNLSYVNPTKSNLAVKKRPLNQLGIDMASPTSPRGGAQQPSYDDKMKVEVDTYQGVTGRGPSFYGMNQFKRLSSRCKKPNCNNPVHITSKAASKFCLTHGGGKECKFPDCANSVRGRTKFCIAHGGGKRCEKELCTKSAIGSTRFCKRHGGGKRCQAKDCKKSAQGATSFCVAHGGGKRCEHADCTKLARGRSAFCIPHGGGTRCMAIGCNKLAQGSTKLCIAHGGGKRCQDVTCQKSAIGSTKYCVGHGGGKRCLHEGCMKSAIASTKFCVGHGGGKRCQKPMCTKSAIGKTKFCIAHGGKRVNTRT